jgi:hypothetical protein
MPLDDARLRDALATIHAKLSHDEAGAIVDVARLAASADGKMNLAEMGTVARLSKIFYAMAGEDERPVPTDAPNQQRLAEIGKLLEAIGPRELAFAGACLIMHTDRKITAGEQDLARRLAEALLLATPRAKELDAMMSALLK